MIDINRKVTKTISLKLGLATAFVVCWIAAIVIVISISGIFMNVYFGRSLRSSIDKDAANILSHIEIRLAEQITSSKAISYDGVVRDAYKKYLNDSDENRLYRTCTEYLTQEFSRNADIEAIFISFWDKSITARVYQINLPDDPYAVLTDFRRNVKPVVMDLMSDTDTAIRFCVVDGNFYLCRNLVDSHFVPYATITIQCDTAVMFQSLHSSEYTGTAHLSLDGIHMILEPSGNLRVIDSVEEKEDTVKYSADIDGHRFSFSVEPPEFNIWLDMPGLKNSVIISFLLVLPLILLVMWIFYLNVSKPMETLTGATTKVQSGERGYLITEKARSTEFSKLYSHFNSMSSELKLQFDKSIEEQRELQQAQIKALQSQINPHFLNNTLEIINWEARLADCESVSEMIEALSTMLDASLDRKGANLIPLSQEIEYVDAYLFIIRKRLGESFIVEKHIDESIMNCIIPRLVLQPLAENAVDHDIVPRRGGLLTINGYRENGNIILSMEHDGEMSSSDIENISRMLSESNVNVKDKDVHIGLSNVYSRLRLLYGESCTFSVEQTKNGKITATICFPEQNCL